jgi:hypothetical protein
MLGSPPSFARNSGAPVALVQRKAPDATLQPRKAWKMPSRMSILPARYLILEGIPQVAVLAHLELQLLVLHRLQYHQFGETAATPYALLSFSQSRLWNCCLQGREKHLYSTGKDHACWLRSGWPLSCSGASLIKQQQECLHKQEYGCIDKNDTGLSSVRPSSCNSMHSVA